MKEQFRKVIAPKINSYGLPRKEVRRFREGLGIETNLATETREDESSEEESRRYPALVKGGKKRMKLTQGSREPPSPSSSSERDMFVRGRPPRPCKGKQLKKTKSHHRASDAEFSSWSSGTKSNPEQRV